MSKLPVAPIPREDPAQDPSKKLSEKEQAEKARPHSCAYASHGHLHAVTRSFAACEGGLCAQRQSAIEGRAVRVFVSVYMIVYAWFFACVCLFAG